MSVSRSGIRLSNTPPSVFISRPCCSYRISSQSWRYCSGSQCTQRTIMFLLKAAASRGEATSLAVKRSLEEAKVSGLKDSSRFVEMSRAVFRRCSSTAPTQTSKPETACVWITEQSILLELWRLCLSEGCSAMAHNRAFGYYSEWLSKNSWGRMDWLLSIKSTREQRSCCPSGVHDTHISGWHETRREEILLWM